MKKNYEILEHKADLKIRAFGESKEELFLNMMIGMTENMKPEIKKPPENSKKDIKIKSVDLVSLLVDFLSEVLYLSQANKETYFNAKFTKLTDTETEAKIFCQKVERFGEDIKAVTYHDLEVKNVNGNWTATVLFDI
jgi:SHS2 domain-containing protein